MKDNKINTLVTAAMLAALTCIATMIIKVPTVGTNGYVNIGDTIVLLSTWLLGNPYGALAAGIGSGLADLISGYGSYVPGTTIIKFLMSFAAFIVYRLIKKTSLPSVVAFVVSGIVAEAIMVVGYFAYEATFLGYGLAAAASVGSNIIQAVTCLVIGVVLVLALSKIGYFKTMLDKE